MSLYATRIDTPIGALVALVDEDGALAERVGRPTASRAVGRANATNPLPIVVPCHRVIGADGTPTGYAGGIDAKTTLLALEQTS